MKTGERMVWNGCQIQKTTQGYVVIDPLGAESREDMTLTEAKAYTLMRQDRIEVACRIYRHWNTMKNGTRLDKGG